MSGTDAAARVPALRFPEFEGDWDEKQLGDGIELISGQHLSPSEYCTEPSGTPYFTGPSDFTNESNALTKWALKDGNRALARDVLLTVKGNGVGELWFLKLPEVAMGRQLMALRENGFLSEVVFQVLGKRLLEFQALAAGNLIPGLSRPAILKMRLSIPSLPEQKKIAAFLGVVDAKIAGLKARQEGLERYKRGLMQALFSQRLRFTRSDGTGFPDWEEKRLGDLSTKNDSGIYKNRDLYGSGCNIVGVADLFKMNAIDGQTFRKVPLDDDEIEKNTLEEGDIIYAESSLVRSGIAKAVYVTAKGAGTAFAWHTRRFSVNSQLASSAFIFYYLESPFARRYIESVATQTALTGITTKDYFKTPVRLPHPDEQQKIADTLRAMDAKISAVAGQVAKMEDFKKGLLQQMFV